MDYCKSILVVEDNEDIRQIIVEVLSDEGYSVSSAADGGEGLEILRTLPVPSLVLLDLMMPSMNGWQFLEERKRDISLAEHRVITISAQDGDLIDADGSIPKPILLRPLLSVVRKFCGEIAAPITLKDHVRGLQASG